MGSRSPRSGIGVRTTFPPLKKRKAEAAEWAEHFLKERQVEELYTKGFF